MPSLSAAEVVTLWECVQPLPAWQRGVAMLAPRRPHARPRELAALSLGERNAELFALRESVLGGTMRALVKCPSCRDTLEFDESVDAFLDDYVPPRAREFDFADERVDARLRLLDSNDLALCASRPRGSDAVRFLVSSAVRTASVDGKAVSPDEIPDQSIAPLGEALALHDPLAFVRVPLACANCSHAWRATLDIASFFWIELDAFATRILDDVRALALAYSWPESEILAMSSARRRYYLEHAE